MTNKNLLVDFLDWMNDIADEHPMMKQRTNNEIVSMYMQSDRNIFKPPPINHQVIIDIFNSITGQKAKLTKSRKSLINGRAAEGNKEDQFRAVFWFKFLEWNHDLEMKKYITIETLLRASKFQAYLEAARADFVRRNPVSHTGAPTDDFGV